MTDVTIRRYTENDAEAVVAFFAECASQDSGISSVSLPDWKYFTSRPFNNNATDFAVGEIDRTVISLLTSMVKIDEALGRIRHFRIIVHPEFRRKRIGSLLLHLMDSQDSKPVIRQCNVLGRWEAGAAFLSKNAYSVAHSELLMSVSDLKKRSYPLPEGYSLRPYRPDDTAWWAELSNDAYRNTENAILQTADSVASEAAADGFYLWVLSHLDKNIGFSHSIASGDNGLLNSIVVDPAYRGKKLGNILMAASINTLIDQGCRKLELNVDSDNVAAIALYRWFGFAEYDSMNLYRRYE